MWIRRVAVSHWRGLDFDLAGLSPGLNLIAGPNESGKSRLVEALRFALFESSSGRSAYKKALSTWGLAPGKPRVIVELEHAGTLWKLEKEFLGSGHNTVLRSDSTTLEGPDAEARLAELMGVDQGGRVERRPEDRGIWSLLWVDQGASRDAPAHNEISQSRVHDRLTREIGEVAAGELGQQILRRAQEHRDRFYTASREAEKSVLSEPRGQVARLEQRLHDAIARRDEIAHVADELDRQRAAERDLLTRVAQAEQRLGDVRGRHETAVELGRRLELYDEQVRGAESRRDQAAEALQTARALMARIAERSAQVEAAAQSARAAEASRRAAQRSYDDAARAAAEADQRHAEQEREVLVLRRRRELVAMHQQAERLRARLQAVSDVDARLGSIQDELARLPRVTGHELEHLRRAEHDYQSARARLQGASASVEIEAHRDLQVSSEALAAGATRRLLVEDEQRVDVEGVLTITVRAGGGELPKLRDAMHDAERTITYLLESLGVADLTEAERVAARRRELEQARDTCRGEIERHLPEGRERARAELGELDLRLAHAGETTPGAGLVGAGSADAPEAASADRLDAAEALLRTLSAERDERRVRRDIALEALATAREAVATGNAELESRRRELGEAEDRRRSLPEISALEARHADAEREWRERIVGRDEMDARFDALGGDDIQLDVDQAERAWEQLCEALQETRVRRAGLEARLESAGDDGRHELVQELEADLERASAELAAAESQAAAAKRLYDVLLEEYERARERLAEPVIARIRPHLSLLFPGTEVWLDDDLNLLGLRSAEADQQFDALSGGAREQLALLVRIGLAEVVGADEPWPLVLDDVLVNTDAERIRAVQRLLYQASRRMQILLFTCHGPLFDALGADRRIELPPSGAGFAACHPSSARRAAPQPSDPSSAGVTSPTT